MSTARRTYPAVLPMLCFAAPERPWYRLNGNRGLAIRPIGPITNSLAASMGWKPVCRFAVQPQPLIPDSPSIRPAYPMSMPGEVPESDMMPP
jgi:hypothetical protein